MRKLPRKIAAVIADLIVIPSPRLLRKALVLRLEKHCPEQLAHNFNKPAGDWDEEALPTAIGGFEDLAFLFWSTPVTRGLIRQDIDEAAALYGLVHALPRAKGVEVGRFNGGSTVLIGGALGEGGRLLSIDLAPRDDEALRRVLAGLGLEAKVELVTADANEVERDGPFDFVLIDGDHSYEGAKKDHLKWGRAVRVGGFIVHHDMGAGRRFSSQIDDLGRLRDDILARQGGELRLAREVGSLVIFERTSAAWTAF